MSSMRNAVQRRNHRERAQPEERAKWGLLEKRKDYKLRAADHKLKKRKINALKQKASERNEDEFYFGMMSSTSKGGIKQSTRGDDNSGGGGKALDTDVVKLMKTQDQGYLRTMLQSTRKEIERLENEVVLGGYGVKLTVNKSKTMFDEYGKPLVQGPGENDGPWENMDSMDIDLSGSEDLDDGPTMGQDFSTEGLTPEQAEAKRQKMHNLDVKRRKLSSLQQQAEKLATALEQLDQQRARMSGNVGGVNKKGIKFKLRERKR